MIKKTLLKLPLLLGLAWVNSLFGQIPPAVPSPLADIAQRVESGCISTEQGIDGPNPQPSVRQLTAAALGMLELDRSADRAERLMRHTFSLQDMDPASPGYGTVPWQQGHPEIKDPNAIEFTMLPVGVILLRHGAKLSEAFKREVGPHVRAAIAAIRRHPVPVGYSNIYLMKLANLLLLGQAIADPAAVADGQALFDTWLSLTRMNGVTEYDSPTYSPIQADCLALACNLTQNPALKTRLKSAVDFYWSDFAANYFPGSQTMTGPASRNYNQGFVFSDANIEYSYYLAGVRSRPPGGTFLCDSVRVFTLARMGNFRPAPETLALAALPQRVIRSKFGPGPGQDRYQWITPDLALGSSSAYYGPQDRRICAELASAKKLPLITVVADALDAPYGLVRSNDRGGHSKPHHLAHLLATVQEKDFLLALMDLSPVTRPRAFTNLASNITLPVHADRLVLDGKVVDTTKAFALPANSHSVVGLREGNAALAARLFAADGAGGQTPSWSLQFDGNKEGAGRLVAHHYIGAARDLDTAGIRSGVILMTAHCETDAEFEGFLKRVDRIKLTETNHRGIWLVTAKSGPVELQAGLNLNERKIAVRRVNGQEWKSTPLTVNGRDMALQIPGL